MNRRRGAPAGAPYEEEKTVAKKAAAAPDAVKGSLGHVLDMIRDVLRDYGNMSAATVMFVLERSLNGQAKSWRRALVSALGPGFTAGFTLLEGSP